MKKSLFTIAAVAAAVSASAMTVSQPVRINTNGPAHNLTLSPDGTMMLFSSDNLEGLQLVRLGTDDITVIDRSEGAGFAPVFTSDGNSVIYQTAERKDGLLSRDIRAYSIKDNTSEQIAPMSRERINLKASATAGNYVMANVENIVVRENGRTTAITPVADAHSYLWASLSPDGSRIVFVEPFQGVFVCNTDGSDLVKVAAKGAFPSWAGNDMVTYVLSHDDGYVILDSTLKLHDITTGITLDLTDADVKVGEAASSANGTVVYSTLEGDVYLFNVK